VGEEDFFITKDQRVKGSKKIEEKKVLCGVPAFDPLILCPFVLKLLYPLKFL
jgi:hypothetical protein